MPRVSVVIPTYNQEAYISQALASVLEQSYQDFEIVIVNDASTDQTCKKIQQIKDHRIRIFNLEQNQGESAATNYGIQQSRGELIAILHSDDVFISSKLEKQVKFLDDNPQFQAVLSYPQLINSQGESLSSSNTFLDTVFFQTNRSRFQWLNHFFRKDNCLCQTSSLIRKNSYSVVGLYDPRFRQIPDLDFWVRFCMKYELYILPEALVQYRVHQQNISGIKPETIIRHHFELSQVLKQYFCPDVYNHLLEIFPDCLESGEKLEPNLADFLVARQTLKIERSPHRALGLDILFQLLGEPQKSQFIQQVYNFDVRSLAHLSGNYDIFNVVKTQTPKTQPPLPKTELPLVSLIIPTYNGEAFLSEALNSALSQTYPHLELIISDDGSTDKTLDIAESFKPKTPFPLKILSHANYGLVENLNFSITQANGKYIKFLFQDDLLEPNCIETMVHLAEQDPEIGLVFSKRRIFIDSDSQSYLICQAALTGGKDLHEKWSNLKPIQSGQDLLNDANLLKGQPNKIGEPTTVLIPKAVFEKIGGFDPNLHQLLDGDLWFRIMGYYKIAFVNQTLSSLRIHSQQQTQKNIVKGQNLKDYQRLYHKMVFDPAYHFLNPDLKSQIFQKLLVKTKTYLPLTQHLINQYQQNRFDQSTLTYLRLIRQTLAQRWLTLSIDDLKQAYEGDWGQTHQALIRCGLVEEQQTDSEETFVQRLTQQIAQGFQEIQGIQVMLAAMLYQKAYQLPVQYQSALIPKYLFQDFLNFLFQGVGLFPTASEIQQSVEFMQNFLQYIYHHLTTDTTNPVWLYIASVYSQNSPTETWKLSVSPDSLKLLYCYRADIIASYLQQTDHQLEYNFPEKPASNSPLKLGILLNKIGFNPDTFAIIPILKKIDLTKFRIILYSFRVENDIMPELYLQPKNPPIQLPEALGEAVSRIRQDNLDWLLIGSDVTAETNTTFKLALHRLARQQLTSATSGLTTGIRHIDYLLTGELSQASTQREQYLEELITLQGSGCCWSYPLNPPPATVEPTRQSWGATEETVIFAISGKLDAIAQEFRDIALQILKNVPQSILVLLPQADETSNPLIRPFFHRMQLALQDLEINRKRLVMVKPLISLIDLKNCLKLADIYLDLCPAYNSYALLEALILGVVPVVFAGQTPWQRKNAALLKELDIEPVIVPTKNAYLELGITLGNDQKLRQQYRDTIKNNIQNNPPFLDEQAYVKQLETLLTVLT